DGRDLQVNISGAPLRDETGAIVGAIAVSRDVTERRLLERRTQEALDALLAMARELVATDARKGTRELAARLAALARQVLGCEIVSLAGIDPKTGCFVPLATVGRTSKEEAAWYATLSAFRPEDYFFAEQLKRLHAGEPFILDVAAAIQRGLPMYGTQAAVIAPLSADGTLTGVLSAAYTSSAHEFSAGELALASGFAQMAHLVLQRERLLSEREAARAEALALTESTRRMDEFLGIASHELRTPLTSIKANVQMAGKQLQSLHHASDMASQDGLDSLRKGLERSALLLERTERGVVRMDRLVGDLLDVSRIHAGKLELRPEPCDLLAIVREAVLEQQTAWPSRSISLDLPRRAEVTIHADADRIGQVVTNFLTNALKYSLPDQPVAVHVRVQGGCARVEVRDSGQGLSPEEQRHLFQQFYRVPGITQQSGSGIGLGLGLHICKTIIERHGGEVAVESAPGEGSTFWFALPLAMSPAS
ncbi:MAG TPA: PAS domain-containing sensor histidine kinase, partial [Ktedonobacterales bacterium]